MNELEVGRAWGLDSDHLVGSHFWVSFGKNFGHIPSLSAKVAKASLIAILLAIKILNINQPLLSVIAKSDRIANHTCVEQDETRHQDANIADLFRSQQHASEG